MRQLVFGVGLIACSPADPGTSGPDAPPPIPVVALPSCPSSVAGTVFDSPTTFVPVTTTIGVGDVVRFDITAEHFLIPNIATTTDPALMVGRGQTKCFRFGVPGTYGFACGAHGFAGTIVVE
jgi:plastocyanin